MPSYLQKTKQNKERQQVSRPAPVLSFIYSYVSCHSSPDSSSEEEIYSTPAAQTPAETPSAPCDDNPVYHLNPETDESSFPVDPEPSTGPDLLQSYDSDRERAKSLQEEYKADEEVDGLGRPIIRRVKSHPTKAAMIREEAGNRPQEDGKKQTRCMLT